MSQKFLRFLVLVPVILVLTACDNYEEDEADYDDEDAELSIELVVSDTSDNESDSFGVGQQIKFTVSITNDGTEEETLTFGNTCIGNFLIEAEGGTSPDVEVFRLSNMSTCLEQVVNLELSPGETNDYIFVWNQMTDEAVPVAVDPGMYVVTAWYRNYEDEVSAAFEIE